MGGVGLVRGGAGTALVGNPQQVAGRIREYQALGIDNFIFSGYPHLEEAHRFADLVMPLLPLALHGDKRQRTVNTGPFGETIGGDRRPEKPAAPAKEPDMSQQPMQFAYWVPNVSGGLVISQIPSAPAGMLNTTAGWRRSRKKPGLTMR